jgi:hypothetical protein
MLDAARTTWRILLAGPADDRRSTVGDGYTRRRSSIVDRHSQRVSYIDVR